MAQFGRPSTDTTIGTYTDQAAGTTNIYTTIDETVASDTDYIRSVTDPSSAAYVTKLTSVTDPVSSSGHTIRARMGTDVASGGNQINATVELRQGYVSEGSQGTLIATLTQNNISQGSFTDYSLGLTTTEADSITNYADLFLRVVMNKP
jgi:hypothetical protein